MAHIKLLISAAMLIAFLSPVYSIDSRRAVCTLQASKPNSINVTGVIELTQSSSNETVRVSGVIEVFTAQNVTGKHGFHIHMNAVPSDGDCSGTGGHYNPFGKSHGSPHSATRHVGDLGNIEMRKSAEGNYSSTVYIIDPQLTLFGNESVAGRGIVLHEDEDDLGLGGEDDSLTTGHAGARIACCTINMDVSEIPLPQVNSTTLPPQAISTMKSSPPQVISTFKLKCQDPYEAIGKKCIYLGGIKDNEGRSHSGATTKCKKIKGILAELQEVDQKHALLEYLRYEYPSGSAADWWVGGKKTNGKWTWVTNKTQVVDDWQIGEPWENYAHNNDCLLLGFRNSSGKYYSRPCTFTPNHYICEKMNNSARHSAPTSLVLILLTLAYVLSNTSFN